MMSLINLRKWGCSLIFALLLLVFLTQPVFGQNDGYTIHVRKDFGYGWGSDIQGRFTVTLLGEEQGVEQVDFLLDGEVLAVVTDPPFRYQFQTQDYEPGAHTLSAQVQLSSGRTEATPALKYRFISGAQARQQVTGVLLWVGGGVVGIMALVGIIQIVFSRRKKASTRVGRESRGYGLLGGTICPKCGTPFPRHIWGVNLVVGRLDRCERCGKWVMTKRASLEEMRSAEKAEIETLLEDADTALIQHDEGERLEATKYIDEL